MVWAKGRKLQDGKYVIEKELDQGGFGITYLVKRDDGQKFVVKTLNDDMQKSSNFSKYQQNFVNEALRLARCSHPNIVRVEELIQERNLWGIVMEYVEGETLANLVKREGLISQDQVLRYIKQVGDALVAVHQNGFLHRDVKPQNIMVRASCDEAVLIDFGIAREFEQDKTQSHTQFLSRYFAPIEQYDKRAKRGAYTDVYALAGTLYYLVTGEYPIAAPNRAVGMELELPSEYNSDLDDWLEVAILKGLEIKPSDRPQSIQEWLDLLIDGRNNQECQELLDTAEELSENNNLDEALVYYQKAFQLQSNNYDVCFKFGEFLRRSGKDEEAIIFYDRAIQINPNEYEAWYERGEIQSWNNKLEEALDSYNHAIQTDPNKISSWICRGDALKRLGRNNEALDSYNHAIQIDPNKISSWIYRGQALEELDRNNEALDSYNHAIQIILNLYPDPNILPMLYLDSFHVLCAWECQGNVLKKLGKNVEAIDAYDFYLKSDSDSDFEMMPWITAQVWYERGRALWEIGKKKEAIESYDRALELYYIDESDNENIWFERGFALWMLDKNEAAIYDFDKVVQINDQNHRAWHYRGRAIADMGQYKLAIESYDEALEIEPSYYKVWYYRAIALYKLGEYKKALTSINKAIKANSKDHYYWNYKGIILDDLERHSEAVDCYNRSLRISSRYVVWYNRAIALNNNGDYFEAIQSCKKSLNIKPDYEDALDFEEIFEGDPFLLSFLKDVDEEDFESCMNRGHALCELEQYQDAISFYKLAISITSDYNEESLAWDCHAYSLYRLGKYEEAIESWDQTIGSNDIWILRGKAFKMLGDDIEAKASYRKAHPAFGYDDSPTLDSLPSGRILYFNALEDINLNYLYDSIKKPYIDESNELDENSELEENSKFDESSFTV